MSGKVVGWAMEQITGSPTAKLVLIKLADNANEHGICWPSKELIAAHTELSPRAVEKHLKNLADLQLIKVERRMAGKAHMSNVYHLQIAPPARRSDGGGAVPGAVVPHEAALPSAPAAVGVTHVVPPHIEEPSTEPSLNLHHASEVSDDELWKAFLTWRGLPVSASERRTLQTMARMRKRNQLPASWELLACIEDHGQALAAAARTRRGGDAAYATAPHNWLERDRAWEKYLPAVRARQRAQREAAEKTVALHAALGGEQIVAKLRRAGFSDGEIACLDGTTFSAGPPPTFTPASTFQRSRLLNRSQWLHDAFGGDLVIAPVPDRRSQ